MQTMILVQGILNSLRNSEISLVQAWPEDTLEHQNKQNNVQQLLANSLPQRRSIRNRNPIVLYTGTH